MSPLTIQDSIQKIVFLILNNVVNYQHSTFDLIITYKKISLNPEVKDFTYNDNNWSQILCGKFT